MKTIYTIVLSLLFLNAHGQNADELNKLYSEIRYADIIRLAGQNTFTDSSSRIVEIIGNAYFHLKKYDSAAYFLNLAVAKDSAKVSMPGYINLTQSDIALGKKKEGMAQFNKLNALAQYNKDIFTSMLNEGLGEIFLDKKDTDSAIYYFNQSLNHNYAFNIERAFLFLATTYLSLGKIDTAMNILQQLDTINGDYPYKEFGRIIFDSMNAVNNYKYSKYFPSEPHWAMIEGKNILYFFKDTSGWGEDSVYAYINRHERAYNVLDSIFHSGFQRKLTFYVVNYNTFNPRVTSNKRVSYTDIRGGISYVTASQSPGYEMTHALSYWGWGYLSINLSGIIYDGLAVAFDFDSRKKAVDTEFAASENHKLHSVLDIWNYFPYSKLTPIINNEYFYAVAGEFVSYLYHRSSPEQFMSLIKDQSKKNAEEIYGEEKFKDLIADFDKQMGFSGTNPRSPFYHIYNYDGGKPRSSLYRSH